MAANGCFRAGPAHRAGRPDLGNRPAVPHHASRPGPHGFWYLAIQPPLLVILAAAVFHFWVVPSLLVDLEEVEERSR